ncbi:unnamed protein product [Nezara viridula]|uniref:Uncharacterized protein n=1 Tax=Nezara viridula TaxID=85310 RepID=A0A9P0H314_NEZVI|nr:unnamed protein product [Nezara viridula]
MIVVLVECYYHNPCVKEIALGGGRGGGGGQVMIKRVPPGGDTRGKHVYCWLAAVNSGYQPWAYIINTATDGEPMATLHLSPPPLRYISDE